MTSTAGSGSFPTSTGGSSLAGAAGSLLTKIGGYAADGLAAVGQTGLRVAGGVAAFLFTPTMMGNAELPGYSGSVGNGPIILGNVPPLDPMPTVFNMGGNAPVLQGQRGVQTAIGILTAGGNVVLGREITLDVGGVRTRPDLLVRTPNGDVIFVEVKTGNGTWTRNQSIAFPGVQMGGAIPVGENATRAGLPVGQPLPPTPVITLQVP